MSTYKSLVGKIGDYACSSFIELREQTAITAGVSNVIYFNIEQNVMGMGGKSELKRFPLCICENIRYPSPFNNMRKFITLAFKKDYFVTVLYDEEREVFILKADGKHYRTKVALSIVLHRRNPFQNRNGRRPPSHPNHIPRGPPRLVNGPGIQRNNVMMPNQPLQMLPPNMNSMAQPPPPPPPPPSSTTNNMNNNNQNK